MSLRERTRRAAYGFPRAVVWLLAKSATEICAQDLPWRRSSLASATVSGLIWAHVAPAPLPAALPLFATGLGGLGLLGWRRKRKAQAVA